MADVGDRAGLPWVLTERWIGTHGATVARAGGNGHYRRGRTGVNVGFRIVDFGWRIGWPRLKAAQGHEITL